MSTATSYRGNALRDFPAAVAANKARGLGKHRAIADAIAENPERHRAYLEAINRQRDERRAAARAPRQRRP